MRASDSDGLAYLSKGVDICNKEIRQCESEIVAFESFVEQIRQLQTSAGHPTAMQSNTATTLVSVPPSQSQNLIELIGSIYHRTLMQTEHYQDVYGESVKKELAGEFGLDTVSILNDSQRLTPNIRQLILTRASHSITQRKKLKDEVANERTQLKQFLTELDTLEQKRRNYITHATDLSCFEGLREVWFSLEELTSATDKLARNRQGKIQSNHVAENGTVSTNLYQYLYSDLKQTYIVLTEIAALGLRIEQSKCIVAHSLGCVN